jgi:hypothetical protein
MVARGQILVLLEWAHAMATKDPPREAMWMGIAQLCRRPAEARVEDRGLG